MAHSGRLSTLPTLRKGGSRANKEHGVRGTPLASCFRMLSKQSRPVLVPSVLLLGGLVFLGCQVSSTPDSGGTGGGTPSGGATGGQGGDQNCDPKAPGSGGAVYIAECPEWLGTDGSWPLDAPELPSTCPSGSGEGGQGGQTGKAPALRRLCEAESDPFLNDVHPIAFCLERLVEDACAADHEAEVRRCVTRLPPCERDANLDTCTNLQQTCPALELGTCWWALTAARDTDYILTCFEDAQSGEPCEDRFFRCAWGL